TGRWPSSSGRSLAVLDHHLAPLRFDASGLHGSECRRGEETWCDYAVPAPFRRAVDDLKRRFDAEAGLLIEDKGKAVSLHWREAPHRAEDAVAALSAIARGLGDAYRIQRGKAVAELVPAGASKGTAIAQFLTAPPYLDRCPVFIGDDLTDEQGFEVVNERGGLSAHVGSDPTLAQFRFRSPAEVRAALRRWAEGEPIGFSPALSASTSTTDLP
ncbi:MAG: trehalose-phosphatase, partial [Blastochloris sp.]|nr:trehalose-phosphatase [Blastochloris sp.]